MRATPLMILGAVLGLGLAGCEDEETASSPLVDDENAALTVLVYNGDAPELAEPLEPQVAMRNQANSTDVAFASVSTSLVPLSWGDPSANAESDYLLVSVQVVEEYVELIQQVEVVISVGGESGEVWCEPMFPDSVEQGLYYLKLQPSCSPDSRDPVTGECILPNDCEGLQSGFEGSCRQDRLTFELWGDIAVGCHTEADG